MSKPMPTIDTKRGKRKARESLTTAESAAHSFAFPFSAIVGQDEMKLALLLNIVDPLIGGVLIMGHRGTAKSTAVRALPDLLPQVEVVADCFYGCDPEDARNLCGECSQKKDSGLSRKTRAVSVVELPLGATEDRVCGTIDIERALSAGKKSFEPGLLARANRGFLYIDEVNLLEDHLVDLLLDVAVTGWNTVEREGVSIRHPARFVLIGSGNPEEGELRPQLLDRFGLHVEVKTENYIANRVAIVERRDEYDRSPESFQVEFADEQTELRERIARARKNLAKVRVPPAVLARIAELCADLRIDGHRGELTIMRAARALAAFEGRRTVTHSDVKAVSAMSLRHRLRRDALEDTASTETIDESVERVFSQTPPNPSPEGEMQESPDEPDDDKSARGKSQPTSASSKQSQPRVNKTDVQSAPAVEKEKQRMALEDAITKKERSHRSHAQSRHTKGARVATSQLRGRYARSVNLKRVGAKIAIDATLRAMIAEHRFHADSHTPLTPVDHRSLRYKLLKHKRGTLFVFAIDTSGSMAANRIARAKSCILKLLRQSYLNRDSVAIVSFHGTTASIDLPPSRSILRARRVIDSVRMGGSTPLSAGLATTIDLLERVGEKHGATVVLLFTDGQSNVALRRSGNKERMLRRRAIEGEVLELSSALKKLRARVIVVDTQRQFESSQETRRLAALLDARFVKLPEVRAVPELSP